MPSNRLEAFSDGVLAIIITIMVLELKVPHGESLAALAPIIPVFLSYVLSFVYLGIYWNNHHHMLHTVERVTGPVLWANLHLLFWLSLVPVTTGWMGENHFAAVPTAVYGIVLFMAAVAYWLLQGAIIRAQGPDSVLRRAVGKDRKGLVSPLLYASSIVVAFAGLPWIAIAIFVAVALLWLVPDRRIERALGLAVVGGALLLAAPSPARAQDAVVAIRPPTNPLPSGVERGDNPYHYCVVHVDGDRVWMKVIGVEWGGAFAPYRSNRTKLGDR